MNAIRFTQGLVALALLSTTSLARADEEQEEKLTEEESSPLSLEASVDVLSHYVWRGKICNKNPVWQPSATATFDAGDYGALSANVWSSFDLTRERGSETASRRCCGLQEIDYTLSYSVELAGIGLEVGHIFYQFPNDNGDADEDLYLTVSYENPIVTPSASVYWNYRDSAGNDPDLMYYSFSLSHEFALTDTLTLTPSASLGFGNGAWTGEDVALSDQTVGLAAAYQLCDHVSLGAQINYTWIPDPSLRKNHFMADGREQLCWGGVNVTFSF